MRRSTMALTATASSKISASAENVWFDETMRMVQSEPDTAFVEEVSRRWHTAPEGPPVSRVDDSADQHSR